MGDGEAESNSRLGREFLQPHVLQDIAITIEVGRVKISGIPMPPQSNHMYATSRRGHRFASKDLCGFKEAINAIMFLKREDLEDVRRKLQNLLTYNSSLKIERFYYFLYERIYTKDGRPKKMDVSNRIKALDDGISTMIGVDDSWFFQGSEYKIASPKRHEYVDVVLSW